MFKLDEDTKKKYEPIIESEDAAPITCPYKKAVTTKLIENTVRESLKRRC